MMSEITTSNGSRGIVVDFALLTPLVIRAVEQHRFDDAVREIEQALGQAPGDAVLEKTLTSVHLTAAAWEIEQGRAFAAVHQLNQALKRTPQNRQLIKGLVNALAKAEDLEGELKIYRALLVTDPDDVFALRGLLAKSKGPEERRQVFTSLLRIARSDPTDHRTWAQLSRYPWQNADW